MINPETGFMNLEMRDYFASKAPIPLSAVCDMYPEPDADATDPAERKKFMLFYAQLCYEWADAMLEARKA